MSQRVEPDVVPDVAKKVPTREKNDNTETHKITIQEKRGFSARGGEDPDEIVDKEIFHNEDGPALTVDFSPTVKKYEAFFILGKRSKVDAPSTIEYYETGLVKDEQWYVDDKLHRDNAPAWKEWDENGVLRIERYMRNGLYHRDNGPAYITYDENGAIQEQINYRDGERV